MLTIKKGYKENIENLTTSNENFRKVLYTASHIQLVLMSLKPLEDIGKEIHENDQFFRFEHGEGKVLVAESEYFVKDGDCVIVPAGTEHNVINISEIDDLKMYTIYSPAHHKDGIVRFTKKDALENEEEFDGQVSE